METQWFPPRTIPGFWLSMLIRHPGSGIQYLGATRIHLPLSPQMVSKAYCPECVDACIALIEAHNDDSKQLFDYLDAHGF